MSYSGRLPPLDLTSTISRHEYDHIRRIVSNVMPGSDSTKKTFMETVSLGSKAEDDEKQLRETRRMMSKTRSAQWPNTLEGLRKTKIQARVDRLAAKEAAQQLLDEEEERIRLRDKLNTLRQAKEKIASEDIRMRNLKSYQQMSYNADVNAALMKLKAQRAEMETLEEQRIAQDVPLIATVGIENAEEIRHDQRLKAIQLANEHKRQMRERMEHRLEMYNTMMQEKAEMDNLVAEHERSLHQGTIRKQELSAQAAQLHREAMMSRQMAKTARHQEETRAMESTIQQSMKLDAKADLINRLQARKRQEKMERAESIKDHILKNFPQTRPEWDTAAAKNKLLMAEQQEEFRRKEEQKRREKRDIMETNLRMVRDRVLREHKERMENELQDTKHYKQQLEELNRNAEMEVTVRRQKAKELQAIHLAQAADKKRVLETWHQADIDEGMRATQSARFGPVDAMFQTKVQEIYNQEESRGHRLMPLDRAIRKISTGTFS